MLGKCDHNNMVLISPSPHHQWPQNQTEEKGLMEMEKPVGGQELQQQQQQQQALKCPRCDSSNTKFCYYNNYSLTQPRHFCKACKRYWTRGGTLRNVPVGGGCRKNKRVIKRPAASSVAIDASSSSSLAPAVSAANPPAQSQIHLSSNPLFYGLPTNPNSEMNLPFSRFNSRVSDFDTNSGYDLNVLGLGFSAGFMSSEAGGDNSNSLPSSYSIFSPTSSTTTTPTMASLLASSFHRQKFINGGGVKDTRADYRFQSLAPFEDLQISNNSEAGIAMNKQVKVEEGQNRMDWINVARQNQIEQFSLSDPSLYWNATNVGAWNDPANLGSSVTSLI